VVLGGSSRIAVAIELNSNARGMGMRHLIVAVGLLLVLVQGVHAEPMKVSSHSSCFTLDGKNQCSFIINFVGEISSTSANEVAALLDQKREWIGSKELHINSPGGNVDASMVIGRLLRKNRMTILIPKGAECASACVLIFAGAVSRLYVGKIGIHRPFFNQPASRPQSPDKVRSIYEQMLQSMRAYLRDMNVSERLAEDMLKIAPADMRYLSHDELNSYGLTTYDPVEQETIDLREAQSLGLDRSEYIRRQALQKAKCGTLSDVKVDDFIACRERVMQSGR
jgi:hypothetical protein